MTTHRIEVRSRPGVPDARGEAVRRESATVDACCVPARIEHAAVYFLDGELTPAACARLAEELLADPVTQSATIGSREPSGPGVAVVEVHPLPGVSDPAADSLRTAIRAMLGSEVQVRTGSRWDMHGVPQSAAVELAGRLLANPVIHLIHPGILHAGSLPAPRRRDATVSEVPLRDLDDVALERLSRDAHLFLSLDEMQAIRAHYRGAGREPREIELETIAQTWSEHCVHKTLKATVRYRESGPVSHPLRIVGRPGHEHLHEQSQTQRAGAAGASVAESGAHPPILIRNLLKSTIAAATHELMRDGIDWCLSVFVDNAGVIAFDDRHAVCFKCETHNHPSAIEPYGGAATGVGGCIRDIMGTGLGARPIASTDVFCVAPPCFEPIPRGCLPPDRVLRQVVAGVRDYGNRMGIPTVNGAVWFDDDYIGNPLVYCGCVGVMPRSAVRGQVRAGEHIVAIGGRTGRDGIHGATFSSAELTDTHADEFSHAVQIGNAITQKKALDAILAMRDDAQGCLYSALTDCGAGGFSSAVGEMGQALGAEVHLDRAPLKYAGLSPTEVWISEAQERMVLAVPAANLARVAEVCDAFDVEWCDLGTFGTAEREIILRWHGTEVGRLSARFLTDALPMPTRDAHFIARPDPVRESAWAPPPSRDALLQLLRHPNIASKHWIVRQYDHEVQGGSVIKPLVGPLQQGPSDAAVIRPVRGSARGLAIANGLATGLRDDPWQMALCAIDECVRNLVCVGADPERIAILDNFSWPSCRDEESMGLLVRAAEGCHDGAKAYRTPFISGKDSLNNQFVTEEGRVIRIPPTLLISGFGIVPDVKHCVSMDLKAAGNRLVLVGPFGERLRGSHAGRLFGCDAGPLPEVDLVRGPATARAIAKAIGVGMVRSAHDISDGGLLCAVAEMAIGGGLGATLEFHGAPSEPADLFGLLFNEEPSRYVLEVRESDLPRLGMDLGRVPHAVIGRVEEQPRLRVPSASIDLPMAEVTLAWRGTLHEGR
jgi:phosphoribosylformylglycinamidine synthase